MLGNGQVPAAKAPASGLELMLKSAGLGEVIEAAKKLADAKSIQKILAFADQLEGVDLRKLHDRLDDIEDRLSDLYDALGRGGVIPGPGPANGGPGEPGGRLDLALPGGGGADRQPRGGGAASGADHPGAREPEGEG